MNRHESVEVSVPRSVTAQGVLEALSAALRRDDIVKVGRLVTSSGQAFLSMKPTEKLGKRRDCLILGVKDLAMGAGMMLESALAMQQELIMAFSQDAFQKELQELEWTYGRETGQFAVERSQLALKVQSQILPKYGFEGSDRGVREMLQAVQGLNTNPDFRRNYYASQILLRMISPEDVLKHSGSQDGGAEWLRQFPSQAARAAEGSAGGTEPPRGGEAERAAPISDEEVLPSHLVEARRAQAAAPQPGDGDGAAAQLRLGRLAPAPLPEGAAQVVVVRTSQSFADRLTVLAPLRLEGPPSRRREGEPSVVVEPGVVYQTFLGFGGSFTESACDLFQALGPSNQERVAEACFSARHGLGYRLGRVHINSCDFSAGGWSCCDREDPTLSLFSIARYHRSILPCLRRAEHVAGASLRLMASPWSPPAWMKDNGRMLDGGRLLPECRDIWASFYVRFAEEMASAGFPLWAMTVQNEPMAETGWENCLYTAEEERDFIRDHLGPALEKSQLGLRLLAWDHNRDELFARARAIYADPEAARHVWGMAFHWYGDPRYEKWPDKAGQLRFDNVGLVHELRPDKHLVMSEACQEGGPHLREWAVGERYAENIIRDLNNWTEAWIDWNLMLDQGGGPNHVGNFCSAPILVDAAHDLVLFQISYYYIAHFSRHIRPGAQRILCASSRDALECTAFRNVDGTLVVVVLNRSEVSVTFWLEIAGRAASTTAPKHSITTLLARDGVVDGR